MFCKKKTQTDRKVSTDLADLSSLWDENQDTKSTDLCFPQDTCGFNVCQKDQTDLAVLGMRIKIQILILSPVTSPKSSQMMWKVH
ncbi:hypothetical protein Bpfe_003729 [Biomphalaria pfeifferi]|uniref:Uncharacterized protein n=1 Tax=Biomphalaria pfeifferi TaxID=112525 RepID=A0AAD8FL08_BIOPF|nr:hypothetical protein Bpfe_003729 [Biomphalaria pfeifferi]